MHVHWYRTVHSTSNASYKMCRCGHRKITRKIGGPMAAIDWQWVDRTLLGLIGHPDGPKIKPPPKPSDVGSASIPSDVTFCDDLADVRALRESIFHSVQRGDISDEARGRLYKLDHRLRKQLPDEA